jgi:hypothetical protein
MRLIPLSRPLVLMSVLLCVASSAFGQMQVFATYEGKRLPVVAYNDDSLVVVDDTHRERTYSLDDIEVRPAKNFAEGFVTISDVHADLDRLKHASAKERADPRSIRARYRATITADRKLSDCFGILTFVNQGSIGTRLVLIGRLGEGRTKNIEVDIKSDLNVIGSLHIFSNGEEVRTSQHSAAYDLVKNYADLVKDVKGLPAADLLKLEDSYPHQLSRDARRLATIRKRSTSKVIVVFDLDSMNQLSETAVAGVDDYVGHLTWVTNDQLVYVAPLHDQGYTQALFLLDAN